MKKAFIVIIALVVLAGAGWFLTHKRSNSNLVPSSSSTPSSSAPTGNTITFDGSSFSPATLTVKAGTTITFKNSSQQTVQVDSNPHPIHTDEPELNVGTIEPGQSMTATVTKTGNWGYHDHLDPSLTGRIQVQ